MNLQDISYSDVQVGDLLFIKTEKVKKGEPVRVTQIDKWKTISDCGLMHKISFENGDEWFGWSDRILRKVI